MDERHTRTQAHEGPTARVLAYPTPTTTLGSMAEPLLAQVPMHPQGRMETVTILPARALLLRRRPPPRCRPAAGPGPPGPSWRQPGATSSR